VQILSVTTKLFIMLCSGLCFFCYKRKNKRNVAESCVVFYEKRIE
jgi:hypothetical protein